MIILVILGFLVGLFAWIVVDATSRHRREAVYVYQHSQLSRYQQ